MNIHNNIDLQSIDKNILNPMPGRILISEPFNGQSYFEKAVIYLAEYSKAGAVGFILNKPMLYTENLFDDDRSFCWNLWLGGPVASDGIFFIHTVGSDLIPGSFEISEGIFWGGDFNHVINLLKTKRINESQIRFFVGYSGWSPEKLEKEIAEKFWIVSKLSSQIIMDTHGDIWSHAVNSLGGKYKLWSQLPPDPSLN